MTLENQLCPARTLKSVDIERWDFRFSALNQKTLQRSETAEWHLTCSSGLEINFSCKTICKNDGELTTAIVCQQTAQKARTAHKVLEIRTFVMTHRHTSISFSRELKQSIVAGGVNRGQNIPSSNDVLTLKFVCFVVLKGKNGNEKCYPF